MDENPTLLDNKVTSDQHSNEQTYHDWKVALHPESWQRAAQVYSFLDNRDGLRRYERFRKCRTEAWFARHCESGQVRVLSNGCKLRWCPLCADGTRLFITNQVLDWLSHQPQPKFLTLTLKHSAAPLSHQVDSLYNYFRQLKKTTLWRKNVGGGVWFFQVKVSAKDGFWHPHLHLLLNSSYIPHKRLSTMWKTITKSSSIVDIRAVNNAQKAAEYVARYCSASAELCKFEFHQAVDCVSELHGRRLCGTIGTARGLHLRTQSPANKGEWRNIGSWWVISKTYKSDVSARKIWRAWREGLVLDADITVAGNDAFLDGLDDSVRDACAKSAWSDPHFDFH